MAIVIDAGYVRAVINQIDSYHRDAMTLLNQATYAFNVSKEGWGDEQRAKTSQCLREVIESTQTGIDALKAYNEHLEAKLKILTS